MVKGQRAPGTTLILEPWVFADRWSNKPAEPVCVGLRLLGDIEKTKARQLAEELAKETHPDGGANWIECFNDCIIRQVAALGMCDPNNVSRPHELFPYAEAQVSEALTSPGALFIFEAIDRYEIGASPIGVAAGADEIQALAALLPNVRPDEMPKGLRRLLSYVVDELDLLFGEETESVDAVGVDDSADEVGVSVVN